MGASRSKPFVSCASPPVCEPRSPPTASVLAEETSDGAGGSSGVLACIPPSEAAGPLRKRLRSSLPEDGRDAKRIKDVGNGDVRDTALLNNDGQFQLASAEPESLLFSCQPLGAASDMVPGPSRSAHGMQPMRSFKLDGAKHKIFLSHAGAQKDFVEQLCVDLEHMGYFFPFFDQRHHSLPKGEDFGPLIIDAAQLCHVAVIVLSKEFLCSKWPMVELVEFYSAQQGAKGKGGKLKLLPLFFKLSIEEVKDESRWMPVWKEHAAHDRRIDLSKWSAAVKALCKSNGLEFGDIATKEVAYRKCVVQSIFKLSPPDLLFGSFESMVGSSRMCEAMSRQFVEDTTIGAKVLGIYAMAGLGKTMLAKALLDYLHREFLGKVCYVDMDHASRVERQKWILKMLCGFDKDVLDYINVDVEKLLDLRKSGMINFGPSKNMDYGKWHGFKVPSLYKEFAKWYAMDHNVSGLKNAWGVFQPGGMNMRGDSSTPIKSWSNLIRLRIFPITLATMRLIVSKRMQELSNLVVLQLFSCLDLIALNLEGLHCLRHLELFHLPKLVTITLSENSSMEKYAGIYDSLQHVRLIWLESLVYMPDLRPCTSLHSIFVKNCEKWVNLEGADCLCVKDLFLHHVYPNQFERLLDFKSLQSLEEFIISARSDFSDFDYFRAKWILRVDRGNLQPTLEGEGPCAKLLKELNLLLYNMSCISFTYPPTTRKYPVYQESYKDDEPYD